MGILQLINERREHETTTGGVKYLGSSLAKPPSINHRVINVLYKVRLTR